MAPRATPAVLRPRGQGARPLDASRRLLERRGVPTPHLHRGIDALLPGAQPGGEWRPPAPARGRGQLRALARRGARAAQATGAHPRRADGHRALSRARHIGVKSWPDVWQETRHGPAPTSIGPEPLAQRSLEPGASRESVGAAREVARGGASLTALASTAQREGVKGG